MIDEATSRKDFNFVQCNTLAALTFLVYDILLLLDLEVEFVWKQRWSGGKLLYTWNRLFGLSTIAINVTAYFYVPLQIKVPIFFTWWEATSLFVGGLTIEFVLQARVYAVYAGNKKILLIMACSFLVSLGVTLFFFIKYIESDYSDATMYACLWVPSLVFEAFLCLLMASKATMLYRREVRSPLLFVIIRDSMLYFVIFFTTMLVNCIGGSLRPDVSAFGLSWALAVPCALGSRLLLNMRREYFGARECFNESGVGTVRSVWRVEPIRSGVLSSVVFNTSK